MTTKNKECTELRKPGLFGKLKSYALGRLYDHIASCPRCRRRLAGIGKVELAMKLIVSQPHSLALLQQANLKTLNMLRHAERFSPKADTLRSAKPRADWSWRNLKTIEKIFGAAACIAVLALLKIGIFSSLEDIRDDSQTVMQNYYAKHLDGETVQELFPDNNLNA